MIESILSLLATEIGSPATKRLMQMVPNDEEVYGCFRKIAVDLEDMQGFLERAETMRAQTEDMEEWVGKVREAVYDVQDLMDEFLGLTQSHHTDGLLGHAHKISHFPAEYLRARNIAAEVQKVWNEIHQIAERRKLFKFSGNVDAGRSTQGSSNTELQRELPGFNEGDMVLGIDGIKDQVIQLLTNDEKQRRVVSVLGMGGLGKTTLVRTVYKHPGVSGWFRARAWVSVTKSFKKIDDLLSSMMDELRGAMSSNIHNYSELSQLLGQERYLIILDDLWDVSVFDQLVRYLPSNNNGSRILVTTRNQDVAASISIDRSYVLNISPLSDMDARLLFHKAAFGSLTCPPELDKWSREITNKCKGLPLAIVAIGRMMAGEPATDIAWENMCHRLEWEISNNERLEGMTQVLMLSYKCLPYDLQRCFLYCSLFKEGQLIKTKRLVHMWIAEGYVIQDANDNRTMEEIGVDYVKQLATRSIIQVLKKDAVGRPKVFQVHDIMRNLALKASKGENLCVTMADQLSRLDKRCRRLSIMEGIGERVQPSHHLSSIRTLLISPYDPSFTSHLQEICRSLKFLRVLDLRGAPIQKVPSEVFCLFNLRYLSLRGTSVAKIPSTLGDLYNIQTLDLWKTKVTKLPRRVVKLQHLRHLYIQDILAEKLCYRNTWGVLRGRQAPSGISDLSDLQTLQTISASHQALVELERMLQLTQLGVTSLDTNLGNALCKSISKMERLSCLSIKASDGQIFELDGLSPPPPKLHKLKLNGVLLGVPVWFSSLTSLTHLQLSNSSLADRDGLIQCLGSLPNLVHLELKDHAYKSELLYIEADAFRRLETLVLSNLTGLSEFIVQNEGLPNVQVMHLRSLNLKAVEGVQYMTRMQDLHLSEVTVESFELQINPDVRVFIS